MKLSICTNADLSDRISVPSCYILISSSRTDTNTHRKYLSAQTQDISQKYIETVFLMFLFSHQFQDDTNGTTTTTAHTPLMMGSTPIHERAVSSIFGKII